MVRIVSGDNHTTRAALPPSDAEQRHPCAKLKNITSQVRYNELAGTLKLDTSGANEPKGTTLPHHQRLHLANKLANLME
ncbi:hypothetical protein [Alishewanella sp. HL-SH05]|uniref:hypothetical protein n=1 Tax=Alishewanella sp. HL-SH05 TaxID=3461145 RepID=UPI0040412D8E